MNDSRNLRKNLVIAIDANEPISAGDENRQKDFERRDGEREFF